ncbi:hypothetical protein PRJ39_02255 [Lysobacter enzymogenes]|uniref:hypothetical protein n=1 Tax=Lysobacter enzymogenes TaxID=69 RepID=UPI003749908B
MLRKSAILLAASLMIAGCTTLHPYRTNPVSRDIECDPDEDGRVSSICAELITERAKSYQLHFVEFDDQGRPYADIPAFGAANTQVETFLAAVRRQTIDSLEANGASVVVFIHGWKHSSHTQDSNLRTFRRVLSQLAAVENAAFCKRKVVGLYVGWRGAGSKLGEPLENATFWSRKLAAEQVATGSLQRVFAGLKAIQRDTPDRRIAPRGAGDPDCSSRLKTTYVGHSFGGLIAMSALSQDTLELISLDQHVLLGKASARAATQTPDEMLIAINPAMEGARFDALYRAAQSFRYPIYRSPRFLAITSKNDRATGFFFPLGRKLNTITKRYPSGDGMGKRAARLAVGHDQQYLTHSLLTASQYRAAGGTIEAGVCNSWVTGSFEERAKNDVKRAKEFYRVHGSDYDANAPGLGPKFFCVKSPGKNLAEDNTLVLDIFRNKDIDRNTPILNISTRLPILNHHSDIENPRLIEFLRQVYVDSMFYRR